MRRNLLAVSLMLLAFGGCSDDDDDATGPNAPGAVANLSLTPVPVFVPAVKSPEAGYAWQISWTNEIKDSSGVSSTVNYLQVAIADQQVAYLTQGDIVAISGSASVGGNGTLRIPTSLRYNLPTGGKYANVTITATATDQNGHIVIATGMMRITD